MALTFLILFDMRRELYEHLQRLSPRFYASTRLGDIISRINNDVGEIQRVAAEAALAWVGNVLFLVGSLAMLVWLDWRLFLVSCATLPASVWALRRYRRQLDARVADLRQRSADIGSFLIESLQGMRLVVTAFMTNVWASGREPLRCAASSGILITNLLRHRQRDWRAIVIALLRSLRGPAARYLRDWGQGHFLA